MKCNRAKEREEGGEISNLGDLVGLTGPPLVAAPAAPSPSRLLLLLLRSSSARIGSSPAQPGARQRSGVRWKSTNCLRASRWLFMNLRVLKGAGAGAVRKGAVVAMGKRERVRLGATPLSLSGEGGGRWSI